MKALALISGGLDSGCMLDEFQKDIALALYFKYGSKQQEQELNYAIKLCSDRKIVLNVIDIKYAFSFHKSTLMENIPMPITKDSNDEEQKKTIVTFRNGVMLSISVGIAVEFKCDTLMIAANLANLGDSVIYPDCNSEFIDAMEKAILLGTNSDIRIKAPYVLKLKREYAIAAYYRHFNFNDTYSCYNGGEVHCGVCIACLGRKKALEGFDTTKYLE